MSAAVRVAVVCENHPLIMMGGAEYQTQLLTEVLSARAGTQVSYLARRVPTGSAAAALPYAVRRIGDDTGIRRRAVFFDRSELLAALNEFRPHVIYQQAKQSYTGFCAAYARRAGIPFFYHIASDADLDHRWLSLSPSFNTPFDLIESLAGDWGIRHASHVIAQTEAQAAALRRRFGRDAAAVIRNFQPLPPALPVKPAGAARVLWVANLKTVKQPHLFVELARALAGNTGIEFQMVGRPSSIRRDQAMMRSLATVPNLRYLGEQPIAEVNRLMAEAAMHVNTSSFEGFPNTFIQAWACGAVVVSLAVDPEGLLETRGFGFRAGTMARMASLVAELAAAPERRAEVARRAFDYVQAAHSMAPAHRLADLMLGAAAGARTP